MVDEPGAIYNHYGTSLGIFDDSPFALGSREENKEVEHFRSSWTSLGQFPFASTDIYNYSTVTLKNVLFIFGRYNLLFTLFL